MKVDDRTLKAFREQGRTPNIKSTTLQDMRSGNVPPMKHMVSPLSHRNTGQGLSVGKLGYLGT